MASFADASKGRYANFEVIGNPDFDPSIEPINRWWNEVVDPILDAHYRGRTSEHRIKKFAAVTDALMSSYAAVYHIDEAGKAMRDIVTASERTGQTLWAQKFGRFYTLCIIRWLADIFGELAFFGTYRKAVHALFGHWELLDTYRVEDSFLRNCKKWPLS